MKQPKPFYIVESKTGNRITDWKVCRAFSTLSASRKCLKRLTAHGDVVRIVKRYSGERFEVVA